MHEHKDTKTQFHVTKSTYGFVNWDEKSGEEPVRLRVGVMRNFYVAWDWLMYEFFRLVALTRFHR
jgi:hypothetical protein